jgi:type IV fimbrial biogenesis protein FimT
VTRARAAGFTIIEVLIVLAIIGVLVSLAAPSMRDMIAGTRVKGAASDVFGSMIFARSEAIKRNAAVEVIPADSSNWAKGWKVRAVGSTDDLNVVPEVVGGITVTGPADSIRYRGDGRLIDTSTGALLVAEVAFSFYTAEFVHVPMRCIKVDPSGRPSVRTDKDADRTNGC